MQTTSYIVIALAVIGILLIWRGLVHIRRHRRWLRGGTICLVGLVPIASGALVLAIAMALQSYRLLAGEQHAATLSFEQKGPRNYLVHFRSATGAKGSYMLAGDDFRIEAQFVKWEMWTRLFGLQPYYRLERLSGRYRDTAEERDETRSVIDLTRIGERSFTERLQPDIGGLARWLPDWLPILDAEYGSATYMPMADGASYAILVTSSGLIARRLTTVEQRQTGARAMGSWHRSSTHANTAMIGPRRVPSRLPDRECSG